MKILGEKPLHTCAINWIITILNCIDTRIILPTYGGSYILCMPEWTRNNKYYPQIDKTILVYHWFQIQVKVPRQHDLSTKR